jgi:hypothetical protein
VIDPPRYGDHGRQLAELVLNAILTATRNDGASFSALYSTRRRCDRRRQLADLGRRGDPGAISAISGGAASAGAGSPSSAARRLPAPSCRPRRPPEQELMLVAP